MIRRSLAALLLLVVLVLSQGLGLAYTEAYRFDRTWGTQGSGHGQFLGPTGLCVDGTRLYVADKGNNRVQTFSLTGTYLRTTPAGTLDYPWAVAVGPDHSVYVSEVGNNRIHKFSPTLADLGQAGELGTNPDQFNWPQGIAWDPLHARLAVTDRFNNRVSLWTEALSFISVVTPTGERALRDPASIAYDSAGNYYIADTSNNRIEMYNSGGSYTGTLTAGFSYPYAVAVCPDNAVVVADYFNSRIVKMTTTGTVLAVYGSYGTGGPNSFQFPGGVAADASGRLYVADTDNHRIVRLRPDARPTLPATIAIRPKLPVDSNNITATAGGSVDADDDPITYRYQWYYKNAVSDTWTASPYRKRALPASATSSP
jgi:sugar lactone lactonase YvrE